MSIAETSKWRTPAESDALLAFATVNSARIYEIARMVSLSLHAAQQTINKLERDGLILNHSDDWYSITKRGSEQLFVTGRAVTPTLTRVHPHPGAQAFDENSGAVAIGLQADGAAKSIQVWDDSGARHTLVAGLTGSGTTCLLEGLVHATAGSRRVRTWVIDFNSPQHFSDADAVATTPDEAHQMLQRVRSVIDERGEFIAKVGAASWATLATGIPLGLLIISPLIDAVQIDQDAVEFIFRFGRKAGVAVAADTYSTMIRGGVTPLVREHVNAENVILMRGSGAPRADLPGRGWPPYKMPAIPTTNADGGSTVGIGFADGDLFRGYLVNS